MDHLNFSEFSTSDQLEEDIASIVSNHAEGTPMKEINATTNIETIIDLVIQLQAKNPNIAYKTTRRRKTATHEPSTLQTHAAVLPATTTEIPACQ